MKLSFSFRNRLFKGKPDGSVWFSREDDADSRARKIVKACNIDATRSDARELEKRLVTAIEAYAKADRVHLPHYSAGLW